MHDAQLAAISACCCQWEWLWQAARMYMWQFLHEVVVCGLKWGVGFVGYFMHYIDQISRYLALFEDYN